MVQRTPEALAELYKTDEMAWLEQTAELVRTHRFEHVDAANLAEYLTDMAKRDKREVYSRLVVLLTHLLTWTYQPEKQSSSWRATIREQRRELKQLLESATLTDYAHSVYAEAYAAAREQAADETGLPLPTFQAYSICSLDEALEQFSLD